MTTKNKITVEPMASAINFGATVSGVDIENLTGEFHPWYS
jgi:hypothetical protein